MGNFEVVVRPVVFPNIRPAPARVLPPEDDPTKGFCVIRCNGAKVLHVSESTSITVSRTRNVEAKRRVDETRVYQEEDDGTVNRDNFVDVDVANKIWMDGPAAPSEDGGAENERIIDIYRKAEEKDNIEIRRKDIIKKRGETGESGGGE